MKKQCTIFLILIFVLGLVPVNFSNAATLSSKLKGKILLQVESKGEAWYIHTTTGERYYMADGNAAYNIMRDLGVGITNKNLEKIKTNINFAKQNSGKIFLQVEARGEAYYIDFNGKAHYLKDGTAAYSIMRELGLGITNNDLNKILENGQIDISNLKLLSNSEIIEQLKNSVVYIETKSSAGSGFIVESNGYILTNAHVVQGVSIANIILSNNTTLSASVVGRDENIDLALLKVNQTGLKKSLLGDSKTVKQGDEIFTLGYPFGIKGDVSIKEGIISRKLTDSGQEYLEISAEIHPGNSGGPLVNRYGQVVGINSAGLGQSINGTIVGETIKLAIPINVAKNILGDLKNGRNVVNKPIENNSENEVNNISQQQTENVIKFSQGTLKIYKVLNSDFMKNWINVVSSVNDGNYVEAINIIESTKKEVIDQEWAIVNLKISEPYIDQEDLIKYGLHNAVDACLLTLTQLKNFTNTIEAGIKGSNVGVFDIGMKYMDLAKESDKGRMESLGSAITTLKDIINDAKINDVIAISNN